MKQKTIDKVLAAYDSFEEAEPDISTERLLSMTADSTGLTIENVIAALAAAGRLEKN